MYVLSLSAHTVLQVATSFGQRVNRRLFCCYFVYSAVLSVWLALPSRAFIVCDCVVVPRLQVRQLRPLQAMGPAQGSRSSSGGRRD